MVKVCEFAQKGIRLFQRGNLDGAERFLQSAVEENPLDANAWHVLGVISLQKQQYSQAIDRLKRTIAYTQLNAEAWMNLGTAYRQAGDAAQALGAYRQSLSLDPRNLNCQLNIAYTQLESGNNAEAANSARAILHHDPANKKALTCLGMACGNQRQYGEASMALKAALKEGVPAIGSAIMLTDALISLRHIEEAVAFSTQFVERAPKSPELLMNQVKALSFSDQNERSIALLLNSLREKYFPDHPLLQPVLAELLLATGQLKEGWSLFRARQHALQNKILHSPKPVPAWRNEALNDHCLLVWMEQGVADGIWFASVIDQLIKLTRHLIVACDPRLVSLFERSFPRATFVPLQGESVEFEVIARKLPDAPPTLHARLLDVAGILRPNLDAFHDQAAVFLHADNRLCQKWHTWLSTLPSGPKVGLTWRSTQNKQFFIGDSYPTLDTVAGWIKQRPDIVWINLQYDDPHNKERQQLETLSGLSLHQPPELDLMNDFEGQAALLSTLDAVLAPANTPGVLAAALGRPVICLWSRTLRIYWRTHGLSGTPWFPTMRLCHRPNDAEWTSVTTDVLAALDSLLPQPTPSLLVSSCQ